MAGRSGDALIRKVYEVVDGLLGAGECIAHIRIDYFNVLLRFPREFNPILDRIIELNASIRDMEDPRFHGRGFCGFGVYPLEPGVDFLTAQYNADVARTECPERDFRNSHMEVYGVTVQDRELRYYDLIDRIKPALERVKAVVGELKGYGFSCALDDFGSGYSSYSVLTNAEICTLKIDRSLFRHEEDERERTIIRHIVETARELGMHTVAEGVETRGYVDYLCELGCDFVQGYVFYKPMPVEEFEERFLRNGERACLEGTACSTRSPNASPCLTGGES